MRGLVPVKRAACLHVEMDHRRKSARYGKQIGSQALRFAIDQCGHAFQVMAHAFGRKRNGIVMDCKAAVRSSGGWPCVEDSNDLRTRLFKRNRRFIGIVIVGRDHHVFAGDDAKALHISPHGSRQHHTRAVVMGEGHWAFDAAGRKDHLSGPDMPKPLRDALRGKLPRLGYALC